MWCIMLRSPCTYTLTIYIHCDIHLCAGCPLVISTYLTSGNNPLVSRVKMSAALARQDCKVGWGAGKAHITSICTWWGFTWCVHGNSCLSLKNLLWRMQQFTTLLSSTRTVERKRTMIAYDRCTFHMTTGTPTCYTP